VFTSLDGGGACPPEDIGGAAGYQHLLAALADPASPDHDDAIETLGPDFDPARHHRGIAHVVDHGHPPIGVGWHVDQ
jgi:hypothetical protein